MANEKAIRVGYAVAGQANVTAAIRKPDNTLRDAQSAVALTDSGHANTYSNDAVGITIEAGDLVQVSHGSAIIETYEYIPEVTLSVASILAIWHQLISAVVTAGTIGKLIVDYLNAAISSRATSTKQDSMESTLDTVAKTGADSDTLETLSDQIDGLSPVEPVNIEHSSEQVVRQNATAESTEGTIRRESDPTVGTTQVDRESTPDTSEGSVDTGLLTPTPTVDRESTPEIQGDVQ